MEKKELTWLKMLLAEGSLDILERLKGKGSAQFKDFSQLKNKRTGKKFSPNTLSARLNELEEMGAIHSGSVKTERKRVLGYDITDKGRKILDMAYGFEEQLDILIKRD